MHHPIPAIHLAQGGLGFTLFGQRFDQLPDETEEIALGVHRMPALDDNIS